LTAGAPSSKIRARGRTASEDDRLMSDTPVLIVGAGPTGLTMAAELARRGVACRIVDKAEGPTRLSKASSVHARTLEVLTDMGVVEAFLAAGHVNHGVEIFAGKARLVHFTYDDVDSPYPFQLNIPQSESERLLGELVARLGVEVEWGVELAALAQDERSVTGTLRSAYGEEELVTADWLVGADGAHSTVRHQLEIPFEGKAIPGWFALADVRIDWDRHDDELHGFVHRDGILFAIPMPGGQYRLVVETGEHAFDVEPSLEELQSLMDERVPGGGTISEAGWMAGFHVNSRKSAKHRVGRAFIAGDAAHIHSPVGGQGMNTSIQDAYNLAWKLALVIDGKGSPGLLDSYEAERAPVAAAVLKATETLTHILTLHGALGRGLRNHLMPVLSGLSPAQHSMAREAAETDVAYRRSPIVEEYHGGHHGHARFVGGPRAGDRAPDAGPLRRRDGTEARLFELTRHGSHTLLLLAGERHDEHAWSTLQTVARAARDDHADLVRPFLVAAEGDRPDDAPDDAPVLLDVDGDLHHRYQAHGPSLFLVRPDGYLGFIARPPDADNLRRHLGRILQ
jgi:2-polyprenyl-6-methoxyphenol hydroxylase-like FAD-dependent oxidoreductase